MNREEFDQFLMYETANNWIARSFFWSAYLRTLGAYIVAKNTKKKYQRYLELKNHINRKKYL